VHTQSVILFFNMACSNPANVRHTGNDRAFGFDNFGRAISNGGGITKSGDGVGFYQLPVIHFRSETAFNRFGIRIELSASLES